MKDNAQSKQLQCLSLMPNFFCHDAHNILYTNKQFRKQSFAYKIQKSFLLPSVPSEKNQTFWD